MNKQYNVMADCRGCEYEEIVENILNNRGIKDVQHFLYPEQDDLLVDLGKNNYPYLFQAEELIKEAIDNNRNISILADVDTDGCTSGAIIYRYLKNFTDNISVMVNKGKAHGLIGQDLHRFENDSLVIIVDSLDRDCSQYEVLTEQMNCDVIVLDHHDIASDVCYDDFVTLISSQRHYDNKGLSGAGVCYKFCAWLDSKWDTEYSSDLIDLCAVGLLADVMPVGEENYENRYLIYKGLNNLVNPGLKKVIGSYEFNSKAVLFSIAPLVNASCRLFENEAALNLLIEDDNKEILAIKKVLEGCKEEQNAERDRLLPYIIEEFDSTPDNNIFSTVINTEYGISGLLGNYLLELYNKPILIWVKTDTGYVGSARSIGYGDFKSIFNGITDKAQGFGHEEAFGVFFNGTESELDEFVSKISNKLSEITQETTLGIDVDVQLDINDINNQLVRFIKQLNFVSGNKFKPITVLVDDVDCYEVSSFKEGKHLVLYPDDTNIQIIEWNTKESISDMEDKALWNTPVKVIGQIEDGFFKRQYMIKIICDEVII